MACSPNEDTDSERIQSELAYFIETLFCLFKVQSLGAEADPYSGLGVETDNFLLITVDQTERIGD